MLTQSQTQTIDKGIWESIAFSISLIASVIVLYIYHTKRHSQYVEFRLVIHIIYMNTLWEVVELMSLIYFFIFGQIEADQLKDPLAFQNLLFEFFLNYSLQSSAIFAIIISFCAYQQIFSETFTIQDSYNKLLIIGYTIPSFLTIIILVLFVYQAKEHLRGILQAFQLIITISGFGLAIYHYVRIYRILLQTKLDENFKALTRVIYSFPLLMLCFYFLPIIANMIRAVSATSGVFENVLVFLCDIYFPLYGLGDSLLYIRFSNILTKKDDEGEGEEQEVSYRRKETQMIDNQSKYPDLTKPNHQCVGPSNTSGQVSREIIIQLNCGTVIFDANKFPNNQ